jgi:hypothetical protein
MGSCRGGESERRSGILALSFVVQEFKSKWFARRPEIVALIAGSASLSKTSLQRLLDDRQVAVALGVAEFRLNRHTLSPNGVSPGRRSVVGAQLFGRHGGKETSSDGSTP